MIVQGSFVHRVSYDGQHSLGVCGFQNIPWPITVQVVVLLKADGAMRTKSRNVVAGEPLLNWA